LTASVPKHLFVSFLTKLYKEREREREREGFGMKKRTTKVRILNEWTDCYHQATIVTRREREEE